MTEKNERRKSREWYGSTKNKWQQPAGTCEAQRKVDRDLCGLQSTRRTRERREQSRGQSGRENAKKGAELFDMFEKSATNEKREGRERDKLGDKLEAFLTRKEEEDKATGLMEEMRKNVVAAQQKN